MGCCEHRNAKTDLNPLEDLNSQIISSKSYTKSVIRDKVFLRQGSLSKRIQFLDSSKDPHLLNIISQFEDRLSNNNWSEVFAKDWTSIHCSERCIFIQINIRFLCDFEKILTILQRPASRSKWDPYVRNIQKLNGHDILDSKVRITTNYKEKVDLKRSVRFYKNGLFIVEESAHHTLCGFIWTDCNSTYIELINQATDIDRELQMKKLWVARLYQEILKFSIDNNF